MDDDGWIEACVNPLPSQSAHTLPTPHPHNTHTPTGGLPAVEVGRQHPRGEDPAAVPHPGPGGLRQVRRRCSCVPVCCMCALVRGDLGRSCWAGTGGLGKEGGGMGLLFIIAPSPSLLLTTTLSFHNTTYHTHTPTHKKTKVQQALRVHHEAVGQAEGAQARGRVPHQDDGRGA